MPWKFSNGGQYHGSHGQPEEGLLHHITSPPDELLLPNDLRPKV
ncbi:hypothetical protein [Carboxydothermus pertinax]|nr:hypothetical protein [Carboxydothermus pertinax]